MRSLALGLTGLIISASICTAAQARDQATRDRIIGAVMRCGSIDNDRTWLNCYYGAAQPMRGRLGLPPAPQSQIQLIPSDRGESTPIPAPMPARQKEKSSGFLADVFGGATRERSAPMASYRFNKNGFFTVTLTNGQVWEQLPEDRVKAIWNKPAGQYLVTIKDGALGSTNLFVEGDNNLYKVRRTK